MTLAKAILSTLAYSNHFHYPLTLAELHTRLIEQRVSVSELVSSLNSLVKSKAVESKSGFYFLPKQSALVKQRLIYSKLSEPLREKAVEYVPILTRIPSVIAIYLTGSLAMDNTDGHDDIDLLIVTKPGKLWTTRLVLTLYTSLLGLRRTPKTKNIMGKLCLNLYLTQSSLALPKIKRTLYSAYELVQAVPIYDPYNTHRDLLTANSWIRNYLPNYQIPRSHSKTMYYKPCAMYEKILENFFYYLQYLYMKPRITREYITRDAAFFHPRNPAPEL